MKENHLHTRRQAGIWIRVSTEDQAQGDSPKTHEARARAYAEAKGWDVREVYDLAGVSGKSVMAHPETKRMLADIERGHVTALIFSKLARLARNTKELLEFSDFFREHDADLVSLQESVDTSTPSGRLFYTIIAAMAQWEREEIADRVKSAFNVRVKMGKPLSGHVPYGFAWKDGKIQHHPTEAPIRKLAYELFAEHKRIQTVARLLNDRGFRSRKARFCSPIVLRMIQDPAAKGEYRSNYTRKVGNRVVIKPEHEWVFQKVEPIVSVDLWDRCNAILDARKTGHRPGPRPVHTFTGLVFCQCGKKMRVLTNSPKYTCEACKNKIPITDLDNVFRDELRDYLVNPVHVADYIRGANKTLTDKLDLVSALQGERKRLKEEIESTFTLYHSGGLSVDQFKARFAPLDARQKEIEAELPRLEGEIDCLKVNGLTADKIIEEGQDLYAKWPKMNPTERRACAESLVKSIVIGKGEVIINACYVPSLENMTESERTQSGCSG